MTLYEFALSLYRAITVAFTVLAFVMFALTAINETELCESEPHLRLRRRLRIGVVAGSALWLALFGVVTAP
ncbi:hypothetical protein B2J88_41095 [Rhodococcus sp. SRB_17]|nr:hypothetical protein [Rhodococcus sp. SRB_17]